MICLEVQGLIVPHWKALRCARHEPIASTLNICHEVLKIANLPHRQDFVNSQLQTTVRICFKLKNVFGGRQSIQLC